MTTASVRTFGPTEDTRRAHGAALAALRQTAARNAAMWRESTDGKAPVPGLTWRAAETAAHMVGDLREYTAALTRPATAIDADEPETPSRRSVVVNARHLEVVQERDLPRLADLLDDAVSAYVEAARANDAASSISTANGLVLDAATMTGLLLGEQLVHGLDIARAVGMPWFIDSHEALLVVPAVLAVAPKYLHPSRGANVRISYELRFQDGPRYRMAVDRGSAVVTAAGAKADCRITADPVAFLLLGYGRIPQWWPIIRGKIRAGGRKPWLAMKFGTLLSSP